MINRVGRYTIAFGEAPRIRSFGSAVGKKEALGPLGELFDKKFYDSHMGQKSFEKAETVLQQEAFLAALNKAELKAE